MIINRVENGLVAANNSVFVAYYTEPTHIYQANPECRSWGDDAWFAKVALLGVMVRWDGSFGFVGGKVDDGESLIEAAKRESMEEINHIPKDSDLKLVCSHSMVDGNFKQNTHVFACLVTPEEMYEIRRKSTTSFHAQVESAGFVVVHMVKNAPTNLKANTWAGTALAELNILLDSGVIKPYEKVDNGYEYKEPDYAGAFAEYLATSNILPSAYSKIAVQKFLDVLNDKYPPDTRNAAGVKFFSQLEKRLVELLKKDANALYENAEEGCYHSLSITSIDTLTSYRESYAYAYGNLETYIEGKSDEHIMELYVD